MHDDVDVFRICRQKPKHSPPYMKFDLLIEKTDLKDGALSNFYAAWAVRRSVVHLKQADTDQMR